VNPALHDTVWPLLCGWLGSRDPFAFTPDYVPSPGIKRMRVGTPPVIALAALDASLDVWEDIDMSLVRQKSCALGDLFVHEVESQCDETMLKLSSPRQAQARGSQISFHCEHGFAVMRALIADGVIGDFREPDHLRFGFAPLYTRYVDVVDAARKLSVILRDKLWDRPQFLKRTAVT
jgi:kynureninase